MEGVKVGVILGVNSVVFIELDGFPQALHSSIDIVLKSLRSCQRIVDVVGVLVFLERLAEMRDRTIIISAVVLHDTEYVKLVLCYQRLSMRSLFPIANLEIAERPSDDLRLARIGFANRFELDPGSLEF